MSNTPNDRHDQVGGFVPAAAFIEEYPYRLPAGSLFKFRRHWAIRVSYSEVETDKAYLLLEGPHAGLILRTGHGMARSLCIAMPFAWFPAVGDSGVAKQDSVHTAGIAITEFGPVIIGGDEDGDHLAFDVNGKLVDAYQSDAVVTRFDR